MIVLCADCSVSIVQVWLSCHRHASVWGYVIEVNHVIGCLSFTCDFIKFSPLIVLSIGENRRSNKPDKWRKNYPWMFDDKDPIRSHLILILVIWFTPKQTWKRWPRCTRCGLVDRPLRNPPIKGEGLVLLGDDEWKGKHAGKTGASVGVHANSRISYQDHAGEEKAEHPGRLCKDGLGVPGAGDKRRSCCQRTEGNIY